MKIAFDAKRALNNGTGLGNHARILLNALMRDYTNNDYLLFTPKVKDEFFHQLHGDFKMCMPETKWHQSFNALWRSYGITKQLQGERVNIYHGLSNELPFNIHQTKIKTVVTIHDLIFLKHAEQYPFTDRQFYKAKTKYAAKHAHKIIAVSNETKRDLTEYYRVPENKIEVIYPSVDPIFYNNTIAETEPLINKKYILNVGSFFPRKNQSTLIQAFNLIKDKVEEDLVLVGGWGNMHAAIQKQIDDAKLHGRVRIISNVSNSQLPQLYKNASVFVFPSLFEGFGAPVLEALFSRTPVIATKGNAIEEAAGKNSLLINPLSAEEIADSILQILRNDALRKKMIESGFAHALTMTDNAFARQTMEVYNNL